MRGALEREIKMDSKESEESLRSHAARAGVSVWHAGDGSDGDALAALFPAAWWATISGTQYGPYASEGHALTAGIKRASGEQ
jgi:hypothetical protein